MSSKVRDLVEIRGTTSANAFRVRKERIVRAVRGQEISLSKERVRQMEVHAMIKLRAFILPRVDRLGAV